MDGLTDPYYLPPYTNRHGCATTGRGRRSQFQMMGRSVRCGVVVLPIGLYIWAIWPTPHDDAPPYRNKLWPGVVGFCWQGWGGVLPTSLHATPSIHASQQRQGPR